MGKKDLTDLLVGQNLSSEESAGGESARGSGVSVLALVAVLVVALAGSALLGYFVREQSFQLAAIEARLGGIDQTLQLVEKRLDGNSDQIATLESQMQVTMERVGVTQRELNRARALAQQLKEEQVHNVQVLRQEIERKAEAEKVALLEQQSDQKFEGVDQEITAVKKDVESTREDLLQTMQELAQLGVAVNEQGQMIATNQTGLEELRRRGERDYVEFDLRKKHKTLVADIVLELRDTDLGKRPDADLRIYANDTMMERKDVPLNTPVNFYVGKDRALYELVVNQVLDKRCTGYVSAPKGVLSNGKPALANR